MPSRITGLHLVDALNGSPSFRGVIVATTTKNNHDTVAAFNNTGDALKGRVLLLQPDAACYVYFGSTNAATATTANGIKLAADERVLVTMTRDNGWVACVSVTGTINLRVWEMI